MFVVSDEIATHGFGGSAEHNDYPLRYIDAEEGWIGDFRIVDVRMLNDGHNDLSDYKLNLERIKSYLQIGNKVVICCESGQSRSNGMALLTLVKFYKMKFYDAFELVNKNPMCNIDEDILTDIKELLHINSLTELTNFKQSSV